MIPIIPLARLAPIAILSALAGIVAAIVLSIDTLNDRWGWSGLVPLLVYIGHCYYRERRLILADTGREREIVKMGLVVMAADRAARFWGVMFSTVATATAIATAGIWMYQGYLCYLEQRWVPLTWNAVTGMLPLSNNEILQRIFYWLGDTNFGSVVLIAGLLMAAPLAAISWRSNNKAKFRRNDLSHLKRRS
jgi:hypothetical protein